MPEKLKREERNKTESVIEGYQEIIEEDIDNIEGSDPISFEWGVVSTGSTLLDLAISGTRIRGGGIPGGIIMEVFGPSGTGKTSILSEIAAYTQTVNKGDLLFLDPEARLDEEYSRIYGLTLKKDNYYRPDTVNEMFDILWKWKPRVDKNKKTINVVCADSLAALSTEMEMESEDKMGMKRAKDFSTCLRKTCRIIANNGWLIACSNQLRQGTVGQTTPGGNAIPYYSSLRLSMKPVYSNSKVVQSKTIVMGKTKENKSVKKTFERVIGIRSVVEVKKSSIDVPFRTAPIFIIFNYGIDDIRGNLQWYKEITKNTVYDVFDRTYKSLNDAVNYIEENGLENQLRERVIDTWEMIEGSFRTIRKKKRRI